MTKGFLGNFQKGLFFVPKLRLESKIFQKKTEQILQTNKFPKYFRFQNAEIWKRTRMMGEYAHSFPF